MVDLAGFDVIGEIHIETVVDLVNLSPVTNPVDGKSILLLGGPFSTDFSVPLGSLGTPTIRLTLSAELQPVIHQPLTRVVISFDGGHFARVRSGPCQYPWPGDRDGARWICVAPVLALPDWTTDADLPVFSDPPGRRP
jgi:hypothetical protein